MSSLTIQSENICYPSNVCLCCCFQLINSAQPDMSQIYLLLIWMQRSILESQQMALANPPTQVIPFFKLFSCARIFCSKSQPFPSRFSSSPTSGFLQPSKIAIVLQFLLWQSSFPSPGFGCELRAEASYSESPARPDGPSLSRREPHTVVMTPVANGGDKVIEA